MFNTLRSAAAKLTRGASGSQLATQGQTKSEPELKEQSDVGSTEQADTLGSFQSFPRRSSASRDRGRQSIDGGKVAASSRPSVCKVGLPCGCRSCLSTGCTLLYISQFPLQSDETATSSQPGATPFNFGAKSLLDAGPRTSGVSSDTAYAARRSHQDPSRFYQGTEGSWMSLQSLQSSLADEPMSAASHSKPCLQDSQDAPQPQASGAEQRNGMPIRFAHKFTYLQYILARMQWCILGSLLAVMLPNDDGASRHMLHLQDIIRQCCNSWHALPYLLSLQQYPARFKSGLEMSLLVTCSRA